MKDTRTGPELAAELEDVRARLAEAEEVLRGIRDGDVDAVMVSGGRGERVYTLSGADRVYRHLVETMSEGALILSAEGVILYCNVRCAEMLERSLDQIIGTALRKYLPLAGQQGLDASLEQARAATSRREIELETGDGRLVPVYLSASRFQSEGAETMFCLLLTDLTEQKSHEQIAAAERLARLILEQAAEPVVVCDGEGRVIRASQAAQRLCEGSPLLRPFADAFPLRGEAAGPFQLDPVLKGETLRNVEVTLDRRGQTFCLLVNAGPLLSDQHILGCVVTLTNITERQRAEAERERLTMAIEQAAEMVLITDTRGDITYVNPAFETVTGYARAEVLGRNPRLLKSGVQDDALYRALWTTISGGERWHGRMVNKRKDGTSYTEDVSISPVRDAAGVVTSYVAVKRDVTRDLATEAQLHQAQKMEGIGSLAGGIAHDFNNLLSVILTYTGLAVDGVREGDPMRDDLLEVKGAAERGAALTRQLLAFSRKQVLQPVALDLNQVAAGVEKMLRRILGEDIGLVQTLAPDLGLTLADPGQVEQVIMNLVVNARDAMPEGGKLTIETANVELDAEYAARHVGVEPGPHVLLAVTDTGCGMDERTMAKIFEPFFTTKEEGKGTGLGLSTVYGIVKQSGGNVSVHSEPGQGTTFKVHLPRKLADTSPRASEPPTAPRRSTGSETILVVEDEEPLRKAAARTLAAAGYTVLTAADGGSALLSCAQQVGDIHLLLTDVVMPRMSGRTLALELSRMRPTLKVLYMSGYTGEALGHHGVLDAGTQFLGKPFTAAELMRKVREVLDGEAGHLAAAPA